MCGVETLHARLRPLHYVRALLVDLPLQDMPTAKRGGFM